jgi:hypothetical protein
MDVLYIFIWFTFLVKILYLVVVIYNIYLKKTNSKNEKLIKKLDKYEKILEFTVFLCLGILLISLFAPNKPFVVIKGETQKLLFLLGFVLILTLKNLIVSKFAV